MLCFLPPVVATPRQRPDRSPPDAGVVAAVFIAIVATLALLFPIGCVRPLAVYAVRVGEAARLGPRPAESALLQRLDEVRRAHSAFHTFFAGRAGYGAGEAPPGLAVDAATGALVGIPTMAGSYMMAVGVSDGGSTSITGPAFMVKVLPRMDPALLRS